MAGTECMIQRNDVLILIRAQAERFNLNRFLVQAVCQIESSMNPHAVRFEPKWTYWHKPEDVCPKGITIATEKALQMFSWGLMQVMGTVYREYGYEGHLHTIPVSDQLFFGCRHLKRKIERYGWKEGIQAYNTGSPRHDGDYRYYHKVIEAMGPLE